METVTAVITLKPKRDKSVHRKHPWLFSGAIRTIDGKPQAGDLVQINDASNNPIALGYFNKQSQIQVRILSWQPDEPIDEAFWQGRLTAAINGRSLLQLPPQTSAYRLINAESDLIPGLVVDKYDDYLVMQCLTYGIDSRKQMLANLLAEICQPKGIVERSDASVRGKEGLPKTSGLLWGEAPPDELTISENGLKFGVNLLKGHKTGYYLDQRSNRTAVCRPEFVQGKSILNVFAYTGGFGIYAIANGAESVIHIDSSVNVLEQAERNVALNGWKRPSDEYLAGDAFEILRHYRDEQMQFDMIILDPPKFAHSKRDINRATRGYKDLNWLAMRLLKPGGLLATFSCSGLISADLFQKVVFGAAIDAERNVQIIHTLGQAPDHPVLLSFPESAYLKGLLCMVC
ncbi:MAG: class I SAM-dependent rRNA methyltransferase [Chloroflexi bacterium]|nr:class I SAM-dependent rRNA methyltransferase [Chloroflexota bacterium]